MKRDATRRRLDAVIGWTRVVAITSALFGSLSACGTGSHADNSARFCPVAQQILAANIGRQSGGPSQFSRSLTQLEQLRLVAPSHARAVLSKMETFIKQVQRGVKPSVTAAQLTDAQTTLSDILEANCGIRGVIIPVP